MHSINQITDTDIAYYGAIDLLKNMIATPSFSRNEKEVADLIESWMTETGMTPKRIENNLILGLENIDPSKPTILLNSHIDTVKDSDSWTFPPFEATVKDGRIYGLGSNDAGASVVSLLQAYMLLTSKAQSYNLIFLASAEEEVSGKNGAALALTHLPEISFAIVGEPTGMNPAIAEKGLMVIDGTVYGKAGHAARNEGINAIYEALPFISLIKDFTYPKVSPLLGPVKVSLTQINAGSQHNVVPDRCTFVVDMRTNECYGNQEAFGLLNEAIGKLNTEINPDNKTCEIKERSFRLNSSSIDVNHPFVRRAAMLGKESFGSPTLSDQALMNFPTVKIGPGDSSRSHTADEYICEDEIREAITLYVKLLDGLNI